MDLVQEPGKNEPSRPEHAMADPSDRSPALTRAGLCC